MSLFRLGKREPLDDPRTLQLGRYLNSELLPKPPQSTNWRSKAGPFQMLLNDRIGCCGPAGALHATQSWLRNDNAAFTATNEMVLKAYSDISGYDPATGKNDNGVYLLAMCKYWVKTGIGGFKLGAYARVTPKNHGQVMDSVNLFGGLGTGWALPRAWQGAKVWTAPKSGAIGAWQPGSWGGHYAPVIDYDERYLYVATWGGIIPVEWAAYDIYSDEAYALFSPAWFGADYQAPNGFDWQALAKDYAEVTGRPAPVQPTPPTPPPSPPNPPSPPSETTITLKGNGKDWKVVSVA